MSIYSDGASSAAGHGATQSGGRGAGVGGVAVVMPSAIKDEIVTVDKSFGALAKLVDARRSALPPDFVIGWEAFKAEWTRFRDAHDSWLSRTWGMSYTKALEYRARLEGFRQKFELLTGQTINFPSPGAAAGPPDPGGFPWNKVFWGAAIIGGLYAGAKFLSEARGVKHDIAGKEPIFRRRQIEAYP